MALLIWQHQVIPLTYWGMETFYFLLLAGGIFAILACNDTKIVFDGSAIKLPVSFLLDLRGNIKREWQTLVLVDFRDKQGSHAHPQHISLVFDGGASASLTIADLKRDDLKQLLQAIQIFAPQARFLPELSELQLNLPSGFEGGLHIPSEGQYASFTQLWENDLSERFGSTVFVPLEPGATLNEGAITVLSQLCFGGLSAVYLAERRPLGASQARQQVILKEAVLPHGGDQQLKAKALSMFAREASILAALDHPKLARVYDYFVDAGRHYLVLEHIEGVDLRCFVRENGVQPVAIVWRWLEELTEILIYLHNSEPPVVHRDVTPDNIVLGRDGHLRLIDFGAANNLLGTVTGTLVGKQSYISPEQFRGKACPQSDLYSLGATIYFCLTGVDPEPLTRLTIAASELQNGSEAGPLPLMPLTKIMTDLTEQEISDRIASANQLKAILAKADNEETLAAVSEPR